MSERSTDIDFDFFDEPETEEAPARARPTRGGPRRPVRPPALTPLLRLAGLIAFVIAAVVVLVVVIQGCRAEQKEQAYRDYMNDVRGIARNSDEIGRDLNALLTTPGIRQPRLQQELAALAQRQEQGIARASEIEPPGALREANDNMIQALQFRVSGLRRLEDAFRQTATARDTNNAGTLLADQAQRLIASDVIWNDLFREPAMTILDRQGIGGVPVPASTFLANTDLATQRLMASILQRIRSARTGGRPTGRHGNRLVSVTALPEGKELDPNADQNIVTATADLAFRATVENSGEAQEVQVQVRLTIEQSPTPIERTETIDLIDPGEQKTVTFGRLGSAVQFTQRIPVRVAVVPVRGETNTGNNAATYQVLFTLPPP